MVTSISLAERMGLRRRRRRRGKIDLRATLRVVLCLRPTSPAEYEALLDRLATSARRLAAGKDSSNYLGAIMETLEKLAAEQAAASEAAAGEVSTGEGAEAAAAE